jgi:hypothetical protein
MADKEKQARGPAATEQFQIVLPNQLGNSIATEGRGVIRW